MRSPRHGCLSCPAALCVAVLIWVAAGPVPALGQAGPGIQTDGSILLPTGQRITPAGTQVPVNSLPLTLELSPDGSHLLVLQAGYETPSVAVLDAVTAEPVSRVELPDAWLGLTLNRSGERVYVGGGRRGSVWELSLDGGSLAVEREFRVLPRCSGDCPTLIGDVRLDPDDRLLYALDLFQDRLITINTQSGLVLHEIRTGAAPYRVRLGPDRRHLVVSHWGEASLGLYRLSDRRLVERIPVGEHPTDLLIVPGEVQAPASGSDDGGERSYGHRLFTACAHSDNLWTHGITESNGFDLLDVQSVAPLPGSPVGSLPTALGASLDLRTLFVANSGNNIILAVDIEEALPQTGGAIPTAWYPTAVAGLSDGGLAYASGKGDGQVPGLVSFLPPLAPDQLEFLSGAAVENLPAPPRADRVRPAGVEHVALVLTDARGPGWVSLLRDSVLLEGFRHAARGELARIAWLTAGIESDFFAKLGPAATAGRLEPRELAAAGRAALPPAGSLWANARSRSLAAEAYGIAGGRAAETLLAKVQAGGKLARLTVVRLPGPPSGQDAMLSELMAGLRGRSDYKSMLVFLVPTAEAAGAAVAGGLIGAGSIRGGFVSALSITRTIGWLLGLFPMTQLDAGAEVLDLPLSEPH